MFIQTPIFYLQSLSQHHLLIGEEHELSQMATELYLQLQQPSSHGGKPKIILAEPEPLRFLAGFMAACGAGCPVFLCNPNWGKQEWQQVLDVVKPDIIWGMVDGHQHQHQPSICQPLLSMPPYIMIPSGGSSPGIKFATHTWTTLAASVQGFIEYFQIEQVNSYCVLPLYHVSGLMQFMRSLLTRGKLIIAPFKAVESGDIHSFNPSDFFISLVPTQLQRILDNPPLTAWLSEFMTVLLGGAPPWQELLAKSRYHGIPLAPTYGMTETASQIATLKPDEFLSGKISAGGILPHANVKIRNEQGQILPSNQTGNITVQGKSLALGYYPLTGEICDYLQTDDLGFLDEEGYLNIIGRNSDKIITGGENIYPGEIEAAIRNTQMVNDICIIGMPDKHWGEAVTAIYSPKNSEISCAEIKTKLQQQLSGFKIPKHWICLPKLPRNSQGKVNRQKLAAIAKEHLKSLS